MSGEDPKHDRESRDFDEKTDTSPNPETLFKLREWGTLEKLMMSGQVYGYRLREREWGSYISYQVPRVCCD